MCKEFCYLCCSCIFKVKQSYHWFSSAILLSKMKSPFFCLWTKMWHTLHVIQKKMFFGNMMLSHWPNFIWKLFIICFQNIIKLIFQRQPSCPRNMYTEHWRKLPNLAAFMEIFLCLRAIVLFMYFQGKTKFSLI